MEFLSSDTLCQEEKSLNESFLKQTALIIVNYNTPLMTIETVHSIIDKNNEITIIIVDNSSTDNSKELLSGEFSESNAVYLVFAEKNFGYAVGNNIGIAYAKKLGTVHFIGIMNPDVKVEISTISALTNVLSKHPEIGLITAKTFFNGEMTSPNFCAWRLPKVSNFIFLCTIPAFLLRYLYNKLNKVYSDQDYYDDEYYNSNNIVNVEVVQGCFFMCTLQTMLEIGMFDKETFLFFEENILAVKIKNINKVNAVLPKECIYHNHYVREQHLKNKKTKIFAIDCLHKSRCYFINKYCNCNYFFKKLLILFFEIDCKIRIIGVKMLYR